MRLICPCAFWLCFGLGGLVLLACRAPTQSEGKSQPPFIRLSTDSTESESADVYAFANQILREQDPVRRAAMLNGEMSWRPGTLGVSLVRLLARYYPPGLEGNDRYLLLRCRQVAHQVTDPARRGQVLVGIAEVFRHEPGFDRALALGIYQEALVAFRAGADWDQIAATLKNIGEMHWLHGQYSEALPALREAWKLFTSRPRENAEALALTQGDIGNVLIAQGKLVAAEQAYKDARQRFKTLGQTGWVAEMTSNLGAIRLYQGKYREALQLFTAALGQSGPPDNPRRARPLQGLGLVHDAQGDDQAALSRYQEALTLFQRSGDRTAIAGTLGNMGGIYWRQGNRLKAAAAFRSALAQLPRKDQGKPSLQLGLGLLFHEQGDIATARQSFREAQQLALASGNQRVAAAASVGLGDCYAHTRQYLLARAQYGHALVLARSAGDQEAEFHAWHGLGNVYRGQRQFSQANRAYSQAITIIEGLRTRAAGSAMEQGRFLDYKTAPYLARMELRILEGKSVAALADAERAKARVLVDVLRRGGGSVDTTLPSSEVVAPSRLLRRHSRRIVLEYAVTSNETYLFVGTVVAGQLRTRVYPLHISDRQLVALVTDFRARLGVDDPFANDNQHRYATAARELYRRLLHPAERELEQEKPLVVVPDGILWELPFAALQPSPDHFLIEKHSLYLAPSLAALSAMERRRSKREKTNRLLAVCSPTTPASLSPIYAAKAQVRALRRIYGVSRSDILIGADATEERVKRRVGNARYIHFATHGVLDDRNPMHSYLVLAPGAGTEDGRLQAEEIAQMRLNAKLVVLAGCSTARGRQSFGEGMIGITWALFLAGCPTTVASQWQVWDEPTAEVMARFYQKLLGKPSLQRSPARALRAAQLELISGNFSHPVDWAGFVIVGDGG